MKAKIEKVLNQLEVSGVIAKISSSNWIAPIVPVLKPSGEVRICCDFKVFINSPIDVDKYPLPTTDSFNGGQKFSKLNLAHAYLH